jgi:hypothetical protein
MAGDASTVEALKISKFITFVREVFWETIRKKT